MQVANCEACVFGEEPEERQETVVRCKRYAPAPTTMDGVPHWRTVDKFQWCGEFNPKDGQAFRFPTEEEPPWFPDGVPGTGRAVIQSSATWRDTVSAIRGGSSPKIRAAHRARGESQRNDAWAHEPGCPVLSHYPYDQDPVHDLTTVVYVPPPEPCICDAESEDEPDMEAFSPGLRVAVRNLLKAGRDNRARADQVRARQGLLDPTAIKEAQSKNDDIWAASTSIEPGATSAEDHKRECAFCANTPEHLLSGPGYNKRAVREYLRVHEREIPVGPAFHDDSCPQYAWDEEDKVFSVPPCVCAE